VHRTRVHGVEERLVLEVHVVEPLSRVDMCEKESAI
jgi:hypothetical protein